MVRHIAKNVVAAGLADRAEVQIAYAIGVADPVSLMVDTLGTGKVEDAILTAAGSRRLSADAARHHLLPRPAPSDLQERRRRTATSAVTTPIFTWERTDRVADLRAACKV